MASRACSRASSMPSASAAPMVVQTCLPEGERATVTNDLAPLGMTRT